MKSLVAVGVLWLLSGSFASAQFAVIDVGAITQLINEVRVLQDQLTTARDHLAQARAEYDSITGNRGMERLLGDVNRNYLPTTWAQLEGAMEAAGGLYGVLSAEVARTVAANSILAPQDLAVLSPDVQRQLENARRLTALQQSLTREALANSSSRFASLQRLIDAIRGARDQKAVLDLQARVGSETTLMENEHSKLVALFQLLQAEEHANQERVRELALRGLGQFATRFQPVP